MDDLLKGLTGGQGTQGQAAGGLGDLLGGLMGSGGLGSILGAELGAGAGSPASGQTASVLGGSLGTLLPMLLPAVLGMLGSTGSGTQSGLHQLVDRMEANGLGHVAQSWVGSGPSLPITPAQVEQVLTPERIAELAARSGLPADQVSSGVAAILPHVVSSLTPNGTLPDHAEVAGAANQMRDALAALTGNQGT